MSDRGEEGSQRWGYWSFLPEKMVDHLNMRKRETNGREGGEDSRSGHVGSIN